MIGLNIRFSRSKKNNKQVMVWKIQGLKECMSAWHLLLLGSPPAVMSRSTLPSSSTCASQTLTKTSIFSCAILLTGWAASVLAAWITFKEKLDILLNYNVYKSFLIPSLSHHHKYDQHIIINSTSSSSLLSSSLSLSPSSLTPSRLPSSFTSWSLPSFTFHHSDSGLTRWSQAVNGYLPEVILPLILPWSLKLVATDIGNPNNHCHHHHHLFLPSS